MIPTAKRAYTPPPACEIPAQKKCPRCGVPEGIGHYGWGARAPGTRAWRCQVCQRVHLVK